MRCWQLGFDLRRREVEQEQGPALGRKWLLKYLVGLESVGILTSHSLVT